MKSPFPGMDPYLEGQWSDVHQKLITYLTEAISPGLPPDLIVRSEERVYVHSEQAARGYRSIYPDVRIIEGDPLPSFGPIRYESSDSGVAVAEPVVIALEDEPMTESYLEIRQIADQKLVTLVEVLSPKNKSAGDGARQYRQKQSEVETTGASLVEIDLMRAGQSVVRIPPHRIPPDLRTTYRVVVSRGWQLGRPLLYPIRLQDRLPFVRIPLREKDKEIEVALQPMLDRAYLIGRYATTDYTKPCDPPLQGDEANWADELLKKAGRR